MGPAFRLNLPADELETAEIDSFGRPKAPGFRLPSPSPEPAPLDAELDNFGRPVGPAFRLNVPADQLGSPEIDSFGRPAAPGFRLNVPPEELAAQTAQPMDVDALELPFPELINVDLETLLQRFPDRNAAIEEAMQATMGSLTVDPAD